MAKKMVRGITDVKTITNQDFDTNNVNDLLSDGQYNYIHRKKGKTEEYHNLTDNIKTISSDNSDLLSVTNNNKTTNTATLHPKHDNQKEQVLESQNNTISINHGTNGTNEKTKIDVNTQKVLTHNNLLSSSPLLTIEHQENTDTTTLKATALEQELLQLYEAISATGGGGTPAPGASVSIQVFDGGGKFIAFKHDVTDEYGTLTTLSFKCFNDAECFITGELKEELKVAISPNKSISNGAVTISYDGTNMKLLNSAPSDVVYQYGTFTFQNNTGGGGGEPGGGVIPE